MSISQTCVLRLVSRVRTAARIKLALEPNGGQEMRRWSGSDRIPA